MWLPPVSIESRTSCVAFKYYTDRVNCICLQFLIWSYSIDFSPMVWDVNANFPIKELLYNSDLRHGLKID